MIKRLFSSFFFSISLLHSFIYLFSSFFYLLIKNILFFVFGCKNDKLEKQIHICCMFNNVIIKKIFVCLKTIALLLHHRKCEIPNLFHIKIHFNWSSSCIPHLFTPCCWMYAFLAFVIHISSNFPSLRMLEF